MDTCNLDQFNGYTLKVRALEVVHLEPTTRCVICSSCLGWHSAIPPSSSTVTCTPPCTYISNSRPLAWHWHKTNRRQS